MTDMHEGRATCADGAASEARRVLVRGLAGAGKSADALASVQALVEEGAPTAEVVLVCATPTAAADAARELARRSGALAGVRALTAREMELDLLSDADARELTGRRPRVLGGFEESFLMEDMRVTGIPARRLKGMLGFFRKSLTEMADDDMASFIIDPREQVVLDALHAHLRAFDAMLGCEVSNLAVRYLRAFPGAASRLAARHVVVDDYQCLNRASQLFLDMLGARTLLAYADPAHAAQGADPFPCLAGVDKFVGRNPGCEVRELAAPVAESARGAAATLVASGYTGAVSPGVIEERGRVEQERPYDVTPATPAVGGVEHLSFAGPDEEAEGVVARVGELLAAGARPSDVLVMAPTRAWEARAFRALADAGVACQQLPQALAQGDLRDLGRCAAGRMYVALALLADPQDSLAWRCWCGCGDYLARSAAFVGVEELAHTRGVGLGEAIRLLEAGEAQAVPGQDGVVEAWRQGMDMVGELASLRGRALLEELAHGLGMPAVPPEFAALVADADAPADPALAWQAPADADAAALFAAAYARETAPRLAGDEAGVRVARYGEACALRASHVIACGAMNGWLLPHGYFDLAEAGFEQRAKMDAEARWTMYELASDAARTLTLTSFEACDLELAERAHLKGYKVRMGVGGRRVTTCRLSDAAAYALHAWGLIGLPQGSLVH